MRKTCHEITIFQSTSFYTVKHRRYKNKDEEESRCIGPIFRLHTSRLSDTAPLISLNGIKKTAASNKTDRKKSFPVLHTRLLEIINPTLNRDSDVYACMKNMVLGPLTVAD
jgi:hypothetical protein